MSNPCEGLFSRQFRKLFKPTDIKVLRNFKIMAWNLGFFSQKEFDSESKRQPLTRVFLEEDADIILVSEINDIEFFQKYVSDDLHGRWVLKIQSSNQPESSLGYLVKENFPLEYSVETHTNARAVDRLGQEGPLFVRDSPSLILNYGGHRLVLQGVHARSMSKNNPVDPGGLFRRSMEYKGIRGIENFYRRQFSGSVGFIELGDFNTDTNSAQEFKILLPGFHRFLDLAGVNNPVARITHNYFQWDANARPLQVKRHQLDDILIGREMVPHFVNGYVRRFKDIHGKILPLPSTIDEREEAPSDHFPVVAILDLEAYFKGQP